MFPVGDWQFWVATVLAVLAAGYLLRKFVPWRALRRRSAQQSRATLTIERRAMDSRERR